MAPPPVDEHKDVPRHGIPLHAAFHQGAQAVKALAHVGRRPVKEIPARRPQSDHDCTSCARYEADTGAKKRTRIPPGYMISTCASSPATGLPISTKAPLPQPPGDTSDASETAAHTRCRARHRTLQPSGCFLHTVPPAETFLPPYVWAVSCYPGFESSGL